jgi:hypothetical protein
MNGEVLAVDLDSIPQFVWSVDEELTVTGQGNHAHGARCMRMYVSHLVACINCVFSHPACFSPRSLR